jgi:hypothetical protein
MNDAFKQSELQTGCKQDLIGEAVHFCMDGSIFVNPNCKSFLLCFCSALRDQRYTEVEKLGNA